MCNPMPGYTVVCLMHFNYSGQTESKGACLAEGDRLRRLSLSHRELRSDTFYISTQATLTDTIKHHPISPKDNEAKDCQYPSSSSKAFGPRHTGQHGPHHAHAQQPALSGPCSEVYLTGASRAGSQVKCRATKQHWHHLGTCWNFQGTGPQSRSTQSEANSGTNHVYTGCR